MNGDTLRPLIAYASIAAALCVGVELVLVAPAHRVAAELRASIASAQQETASASSLAGRRESLERQLANARTQLAAIERKSAGGRDDRLLYSSITALATKHHVTLEQVTPTKRSVTPPVTPPRAPTLPPPPGVPAITQAPSVQDTSTGYTLTVASSYADLARFVSELESAVGYGVIRSIRVTPSSVESDSSVLAELVVEFFAFDVAVAAPSDRAPGAIAPPIASVEPWAEAGGNE
jgi:hypothetical protein